MAESWMSKSFQYKLTVPLVQKTGTLTHHQSVMKGQYHFLLLSYHLVYYFIICPLKATHMAFQLVDYKKNKKKKLPTQWHTMLLLLINEERGKKKTPKHGDKVMSHLNSLKPDVELRNRH